MMEILGLTNFYPEAIAETDHAFYCRYNRIAYVLEHGIGSIVARFLVNKGHKNGKEVHCITDKGLILIFNQESKRFITLLFARPAQITRYYDTVNLQPDKQTMYCAELNFCKKLNKM